VQAKRGQAPSVAEKKKKTVKTTSQNSKKPTANSSLKSYYQNDKKLDACVVEGKTMEDKLHLLMHYGICHISFSLTSKYAF
jgi:hypothetical protein